MRIMGRALALCGLVMVASCGVPAANSGSSPADSGKLIARADVVKTTIESLNFGQEFRFTDGLAVTVSAPKSFQPSENAYPRSERAVAFEVTIRNDSTQPYRLSGLSVLASILDKPTKQVVDSTQGFTGIAGANKDIPTARSTRMSLAFAVPSEAVELRLTLKPDISNSATAVYCGQS